MSIDTFGTVKNTIRLRSGKYFDFLDPQPDQFTFSDIAGALSKICRFGGQIDRFYSVAEHLWHCGEQAISDELSLEVQRAVLMHDAAEAFCGDVVKPLKLLLRDYALIENRVEDAIATRFGIDFADAAAEVRKIDWEMLIAERRALFSPDAVEWAGENEVRRLRPNIQCWMPSHAEWSFTGKARHVGIEVNE